MQNATMVKFGYPRTVIAETSRWSVQIRPKQPTLGSLVMVCREDATSFGTISPEAFAEMGSVVGRIEKMLESFVGYERINYLMLMMVDPHVHFHVIPRYDGVREHAGVELRDHGWPGPSALDRATALDADGIAAFRDHLAALWQD